ncbi:glycosyltransferase, partial [Nostoc sp. NIES-2111]
DIGHVMAHASVAVIASQYETSCRVAMEALEFGCPLVSTPVGIVPELSEAEQTVILTAAEPQAMAAAVRRVLEEPGLAQRMRERGQALVERDGGHRRAAQEMAAVYQEALAERLRGNK